MKLLDYMYQATQYYDFASLWYADRNLNVVCKHFQGTYRWLMFIATVTTAAWGSNSFSCPALANLPRVKQTWIFEGQLWVKLRPLNWELAFPLHSSASWS